MEKLAKRFASRGANGFVKKPLELDSFFEIVKAHCGS
jgi:hypothetical protein